MSCDYNLVCPFYRRRVPIHDVMYQTYVARYCETQGAACAIQQVMKGSNFLKVPADLYPNQTFRVEGVLRKA